MTCRKGGNMHQVFNHRNFYREFDRDLQEARFLVIIQSPFMTLKRVKNLNPILADCVARKVRVCVFTQEIDSRFSTAEDYAEKIATLNAVSDKLLSIGIHINKVPKIHEKLVVIDENILWEGSLNPLSYFDTSERMTRWQCSEQVRSALTMHNLTNCSFCLEALLVGNLRFIFGNVIARRRKILNLSQKEFSELTGVSQTTISRIENGEYDCRISRVSKIFEALGLHCRPVPWYMASTLDHDLRNALKLNLSNDQSS